jgi:hypothetical protein
MPHGLPGGSPKLILRVDIAPGCESDSAMWHRMYSSIKQWLMPNIVFQGDNAFHNSRRIIVPYTNPQINASLHPEEKRKFNSNHSNTRMTSEHGIKYLKYWGIVRGRGDIRLFENELIYTKSVLVCHLECATFGCTISR